MPAPGGAGMAETKLLFAKEPGFRLDVAEVLDVVAVEAHITREVTELVADDDRPRDESQPCQ